MDSYGEANGWKQRRPPAWCAPLKSAIAKSDQRERPCRVARFAQRVKTVCCFRAVSSEHRFRSSKEFLQRGRAIFKGQHVNSFSFSPARSHELADALELGR